MRWISQSETSSLLINNLNLFGDQELSDVQNIEILNSSQVHSELFELMNFDFTTWNDIKKSTKEVCEELIQSSDPQALFNEIMRLKSNKFGWSSEFVSRTFEKNNDKILNNFRAYNQNEDETKMIKTQILLSKFIILPSTETDAIQIAIVQSHNDLESIDTIVTVNSAKINVKIILISNDIWIINNLS